MHLLVETLACRLLLVMLLFLQSFLLLAPALFLIFASNVGLERPGHNVTVQSLEATKYLTGWALIVELRSTAGDGVWLWSR